MAYKKQPVWAYKKQPVCNLCLMAGKKEFNHYTRDKITGKTMCPYLLSVVCWNCNKKAGHTAKYCPELKQKEKEKEKEKKYPVTKERQATPAIKNSESLVKTVPPQFEASTRSHGITTSWANAVKGQLTTQQATTEQATTEQATTEQATTEKLDEAIPESSLMYRCQRRACWRWVYGDSLCECVKNESCLPQEEETIPKSKNDWFEHGQYGARLGDGLYLCGGRVVDRGPTARPIHRVSTLTSTKSSEDEDEDEEAEDEEAKEAEEAEEAKDAKDAKDEDEDEEDEEDAEKAKSTNHKSWADDQDEWMASLD